MRPDRPDHWRGRRVWPRDDPAVSTAGSCLILADLHLLALHEAVDATVASFGCAAPPSHILGCLAADLADSSGRDALYRLGWGV